MIKTSFFVFFVSCEILKIVCCENEPTNPFGLQLSKKAELENPEFAEEKEKFLFDDNGVISEDKSLEKRRLFFPESDIDGEIHSDKYSINGEYSSRRRSDQGQAEDHKKLAGEERGFGSNYWEKERNKFPVSEGKEIVGSSREFRPRQPLTSSNRMYDWERSDISEKSESRWNEEKNFKHFFNPNSELSFGSHYSGRPFHGNVNNYSGDRNSNIFDKKISITTLNDAEIRNSNKHHGDFRLDEIHSGYKSHSNMDYQNRKDGGFWDPKLYKPEKGVIINFNTDCPLSRQLNNQLVHRVIISPKSHLNTQSEVSAYQFPGTAFISAHQLSPAYYL